MAAVTSAMPSYIAVPADQIAFVDLRDLRVRRVPRQILTPPPPPHAHQLPQLYNQDFQPILQQYKRQRKYPLALALALATYLFNFNDITTLKVKMVSFIN